ncbi:hypothetical protein Landi51_01245 [Colletotrichum acutatum]
MILDLYTILPPPPIDITNRLSSHSQNWHQPRSDVHDDWSVRLSMDSSPFPKPAESVQNSISQISMARTPADLVTPVPAVTWRRRPSENECSNANEPLAAMSLNHLKASEIIQRVHGDANNLLRNIQGLLRYSRAPTLDGGRLLTGVLLNNPKLLHAQKISQHITGDMAELVAISQKSRETAVRLKRPNHLRKIRRKQHGQLEHAAAAAVNHHSNESMPDPSVCHNCHTTCTPQWRSGPAGPRTLCNVCGLIHAMRQRKQRLRHSNRVSASSSMSFSS